MNVTATYLPIITKVINPSTEQNEFPNELKLADGLPIYKKYLLNKENYRPASVLSHMSKVFERLLYKQIETIMNNKLLKSSYLAFVKTMMHNIA